MALVMFGVGFGTEDNLARRDPATMGGVIIGGEPHFLGKLLEIILGPPIQSRNMIFIFALK